MTLSKYIDSDAVSLALAGADRSAVLAELVTLLRLPPQPADTVHRLLLKREESGSTGVGHGIAIPHTRCLSVERIRMAYGHHREGVEWGGIDGARVHHFFLIVAPPAEGGAPYLSVLSRVAQLVKEAKVRDQLGRMATAPELLTLIEEQGV
jgi:mannitol/fructose-specific phosphotransferase system IIA component (Ntr-type)